MEGGTVSGGVSERNHTLLERRHRKWMVCRPEVDTERLYQIHAERFIDQAHMDALVKEAQRIVDNVLS